MAETNNDHYIAIGELARLCGVTVRTLQYYDKTGLLTASFNKGGRRMYSRDDLIKLQQILFLKSFGFSLEEIAGKLLKNDSSTDLAKVFTRQRNMLLNQKENLQHIIDSLDIVIEESGKGHDISLEKVMAILELMKQKNPYAFIIWYLDDEQFSSISERFSSGTDYQFFMTRISELSSRMVILYQQHADPEGAEGQDIAKQWWQMVHDFSAGNDALLRTLVASGEDMANWPGHTDEMRNVLKNFLAPALDCYFRRTGQQVPTEKIL